MLCRLFLTVLCSALLVSAFSYADAPLGHATVDVLEEPLLYRFTQSCDILLAKANVSDIANSVTGLLTQMASYGCGTNCTARLAAAFKRHYPTHWSELEGVAACLRWNSGITTLSAASLAAASYTYEISRGRASLDKRGDVGRAEGEGAEEAPLGCAGILTCGPHGEVLQGRNFDWSPPYSYYLAKTTMGLKFKHAGFANNRAFSAIDLFPSVFGATFGVNEAFSLAANARQYRQGLSGLLNCLESDDGMLGVHTAPMGHFLRWVVENAKTFDDAVQIFQNAKVCAPVYIVIGGHHGQGAVLTLGSPASSTPKRTLSCTADEWFLVQTNWDNKTHSTNNEQFLDLRWQRIEEKLHEIGRSNFTATKHSQKGVSAMWQVLSLQPNATDCAGKTYCLSGALLNSPIMSTVYSAVAEPSSASLPMKAARIMN